MGGGGGGAEAAAALLEEAELLLPLLPPLPENEKKKTHHCTILINVTLCMYVPLLDPPLEPRLLPLPLTLGSISRVAAGPTNRVVLERGEEEEGGGADFC